MSAVMVFRRGGNPSMITNVLPVSHGNGSSYLKTTKAGLSILIVALAVVVIIRVGLILGRYTLILCKFLVGKVRKIFLSSETKRSLLKNISPKITKEQDLTPKYNRIKDSLDSTKKRLDFSSCSTDDDTSFTSEPETHESVSSGVNSPLFNKLDIGLDNEVKQEENISILTREIWKKGTFVYPDELKELLSKPCPFYKGKLVKDTFEVVPLFSQFKLPNGSIVPLTLDLLSKLDIELGGPGCIGLEAFVNNKCMMGEVEARKSQSVFAFIRRETITGDEAKAFNKKLSDCGWEELDSFTTIMAILWLKRKNGKRFTRYQPVWDERCWNFPKISDTCSSERSKFNENELKEIVIYYFIKNNRGLFVSAE